MNVVNFVEYKFRINLIELVAIGKKLGNFKKKLIKVLNSKMLNDFQKSLTALFK